jgi:hypothetical protein
MCQEGCLPLRVDHEAGCRERWENQPLSMTQTHTWPVKTWREGPCIPVEPSQPKEEQTHSASLHSTHRTPEGSKLFDITAWDKDLMALTE